MKKFFCKLISVTLVLIMVFSVPVQATSWSEIIERFELPESYSYSLDFSLTTSIKGDLDDDIALILGLFDDGVALSISGTHVRDRFAVSEFTQINFDLDAIVASLPAELPIAPMIALMGIDINQPIRIWMESDFNTILEPQLKYVIELPPVLRLLLTMADSSLSRQFYVLDFTDLLLEMLVEFEAEVRMISEEQIGEFTAYFDETIEELMIFIDELQYDFTSLMDEAVEELAQFFNIHTFERGFNRSENAVSAFVELLFTISDFGSSATFDFGFNMEVFDINGTSRTPLPQLTPQNSVDLIDLIIDGFGF